MYQDTYVEQIVKKVLTKRDYTVKNILMTLTIFFGLATAFAVHFICLILFIVCVILFYWKQSQMETEYEYLLKTVGLDGSFLMRYPHELSGGQLQRICIARAVACRPEIILFDEAISSLDAHTQVQVMDLLKELKEKLSLTYIFITHDLTSVTYICDNVMFLYKGRITEYLPVSRISESKDTYAKQLLNSIIVYEDEMTA